MPKRKLPPNEELIAMYKSGMSCGEIAEHCGVKPGTVNSLFRRIGYRLRSTQEAADLRTERGRENQARYWEGKTQPPEMVEKRVSKIRGENHWLWKGGASKREYRKVIDKQVCSRCGARINLGIHHRNLDHYDNRPENLEVLCVSCHMSLHKQAYWDAYHSGEETPKSNGPTGWKREEGGADK